MATIEIPEDEIVARIEIRGQLEPEEVNRYLASFASASVTSGLEQATFVTDTSFIGVAW